MKSRLSQIVRNCKLFIEDYVGGAIVCVHQGVVIPDFKDQKESYSEYHFGVHLYVTSAIEILSGRFSGDVKKLKKKKYGCKNTD